MKARFKRFFLALLSGCFLLSCADVSVYARKENRAQNQRNPQNSTILSKDSVKSALKQGIRLACPEFTFSIPSKNEKVDNVFTLDGANLDLALSSLSLHGLSIGLDAPVDYNGVNKDVNLTLHEERLFFSLSDKWDNFENGYGGIRFKASIAPSGEHADEEDELTRGRTYFEYGSLDYFLYSIFENFDIAPISLFSKNEEKEEEEESEKGTTIDFVATLDSFGKGTLIKDNLIKVDMPLGDEIIPLGIYFGQNGKVYEIDFPYEGGQYEFNNGIKVGFRAKFLANEATFALPYEEDTYLELEDSLELVNELGEIAQSKQFGVEANLSIKHIEEKVEADDTHFERDAISELGTLTASVDCDLSSPYHDITATANLSCAEGGNESISLHMDDEEENPLCYFDFNGVLKGFSNVSTFSNLLSSLSSALDDETIQNQTLLRLVAGLLATSDSLKEAIEAVTNSGIYTNLNEGHYESLVASIGKIGHKNNKIYATLDLSNAKGTGYINIVVDASSSALVNLEFINAGVTTSNSPKLSLLLNGTIRTRGYVKKAFNKSSYPEYRHLPSLSESLDTFAESDRLTVSLEGYLSKKGTSSVTSYSVPSWNGTSSLSTQGFSFAGRFGFDLADKTGTGQMTFEDHKEKYFNDHNLKVDVTGDQVSGDSDSKDYLGNEGSSSNFLLVEYDSKNNNSSFANSANASKGNRTNPSNGSLKGRFSIHSLDGVLDLVADLLTSTDPRFKRLTNLFSNVMDRSTLGTILAGHYLEAVSNGFLSASDIRGKEATFTFKPSLIKESYPLKLRVKFGDDYTDSEGILKPGKIKSLEILSSCPSSIPDGTDLYAKITFDSATTSPAMNFNKANYTSFLPFSSIKTLLEYLLGTITLGVTNTSTVTTYYLDVTAKVKVLTSTYNVTIGVYIYLDGTNIKILAQISYPSIIFLIGDEGKTTIFFESNGEDSDGDLYIHRALKKKNGESTRRVTGKNFMNNIAQWLGYILDLSDTIRNKLDDTDSSGGQQAIHGEDLIRSFGIAGGSSISSPSWNITIALSAILPSSIKNIIGFDDMPLTISGKTVTYSSGGKTYSKKSLYSLSGTQNIKLEFLFDLKAVSAQINASVKNISSGTYADGWNNSTYKLSFYYVKETSVWFIKSYSLEARTTTTPSALFSGSYGKSNSNSTYKKTGYSVKP